MVRANDRLIVALDTDDLKVAERWVRTLIEQVRHFKIGSQLFTSVGPEALDMVHALGGHVFLDLKFHDTPHTVGRAVEMACRHRIWMLNVHALGGKKMLEAAVGAMGAASDAERPLLIAVTVLTSFGKEDLAQVGIHASAEEQVLKLARLVKQAGLNGVVASAEESRVIKRELGPRFLVVTPGIRPAGSRPDDQGRVVTPKEALLNGSDYLVVGRPITDAFDLSSACQVIVDEINSATG